MKAHSKTGRQIDRQTDKQTNKPSDKQTDRQIDRLELIRIVEHIIIFVNRFPVFLTS